jgi:hypothetical protein
MVVILEVTEEVVGVLVAEVGQILIGSRTEVERTRVVVVALVLRAGDIMRWLMKKKQT